MKGVRNVLFFLGAFLVFLSGCVFTLGIDDPLGRTGDSLVALSGFATGSYMQWFSLKLRGDR